MLQLSWTRWMPGEILWWKATTKRSCRYHDYTACQLYFAIWSTQKPLTCPSCGASGFRLRDDLFTGDEVYLRLFEALIFVDDRFCTLQVPSASLWSHNCETLDSWRLLVVTFATSSISYRCIPTTSTKTVQESIPPQFVYFQVELAFAETFQKLHEIRTDTPVLPVFLSDHNVSEDVGAVNFNELHRLGFRKVSNHKFLDLWEVQLQKTSKKGRAPGLFKSQGFKMQAKSNCMVLLFPTIKTRLDEMVR